jgi:hypothetical protein
MINQGHGIPTGVPDDGYATFGKRRRRCWEGCPTRLIKLRTSVAKRGTHIVKSKNRTIHSQPNRETCMRRWKMSEVAASSKSAAHGRQEEETLSLES